MTDYVYKKLALSVVRSNIKKEDALKILSLLSVSDLRTLLTKLKTEQEKNSLEVVVVDEPSVKLKKELRRKFPDSNLTITVDKKIGAGLKIKKFDMIYDFTIKSRIKNLVNTLVDP